MSECYVCVCGYGFTHLAGFYIRNGTKLRSGFLPLVRRSHHHIITPPYELTGFWKNRMHFGMAMDFSKEVITEYLISEHSPTVWITTNWLQLYLLTRENMTYWLAAMIKYIIYSTVVGAYCACISWGPQTVFHPLKRQKIKCKGPIYSSG